MTAQSQHRRVSDQTGYRCLAYRKVNGVGLNGFPYGVVLTRKVVRRRSRGTYAHNRKACTLVTALVLKTAVFATSVGLPVTSEEGETDDYNPVAWI